MNKQINDILSEVEKKFSIKILYAVESGSRAWGFASENSDWDVRFVYIHNLKWYLDIEEKKDNIEQMHPGDIDIAGWEIKKALRLFRKSNPPLLEWLSSPIIYKEEGDFASNLRKANKKYFNPKSCLYHYFHMAKGNWESYFKTDEARLKKYFYVLRPILACQWIMRFETMPPVLFDKLVIEIIKNQRVFDCIQELLIQKKNGMELDKGPRLPALDAYINSAFQEIQEFIGTYTFENQPDWDSLNSIFTNSLYAHMDTSMFLKN
jgi:predicted nucleotidyltransferase